jgi:Flp pilus assembly protein CpaB
MEALQVRDRRRRRQAMIAGLILALIAAAATYYVLTRPSGGPTPPATRTIVVAAQEILAGTRITSDMLSTASVPDSPALVLAISDPALAVDNFAAISIAQGQPIQSNFYRAGTEGGVSVLPPSETLSPDTPNWRGVSVEAPVGRAVGGLLRPGDHIDLYVTLNPRIFDPNALAGFFDPEGGVAPDGAASGGYFSAETTKLVWTNLEILSVAVDQNLYVLRVDDSQAEEIAHVQSIGAEFTISLRASTDDRIVDPVDRGQTTNELIEKYGFPIPVVIVVPGGAPPPAQPTPTPAPSPAP